MQNCIPENRIKSAIANERGFTLVELLVVLALLGIVIAGAYQYFFYGYSSWVRSAAEAEMIQNARQTVILMENEVREAERAAEGTPSVVVLDDGKKLRIYTRSKNETYPKLVSYRLENGNLERGISFPKNDEYPYRYDEPNQWEIVVSNVVNDSKKPIFKVIDGGTERSVIKVNLSIKSHNAIKPFEIQASLTVRGRG